MRVAVAGLALLAVGAAKPVDPFAGGAVVATERCVDRTAGEPLTIIGERTLVYRPVGRRLWRNDLPERCPGLDRDDILVIDVFGSQLCENDRIRTFDRASSIPGPWCRLGKFTAYEKPRR